MLRINDIALFGTISAAAYKVWNSLPELASENAGYYIVGTVIGIVLISVAKELY